MKLAPRRLAVKKLALARFAPRKDAFCAGEEVTGWEREESVVFMAIVIESVGKGYERDAAEIEPSSSRSRAEIEPRSSRDRAESKPRSSGELGRESSRRAGRAPAEGPPPARCCAMKRILII